MIRVSEIKAHFIASLTDDTRRIKNQFIWIYVILAAVSIYMSIVNLITSKTMLMYSTLIFALLCVTNILLASFSARGVRISSVLLAVEVVGLFVFFIVSGTPEGFSAIWICLVPSSGMLLYQRKNGSILCGVMFLVLMFFFRTSVGQGLLQYQYTESFMLRFPMLYLAFFAISFFLETVRSLTYDKMQALQLQYEHLYSHDALTGLSNRYGFNERIDRLIAEENDNLVAVMILDLDHFKDVNDRYGHINGDNALKQICDMLRQLCPANMDICRWGGEEFAILLAGGQDAEAKANQIRLDVQNHPIQFSDEETKITASIGVAVGTLRTHSDAEKLLSAADRCLFNAKHAGRNRVVCEVIE